MARKACNEGQNVLRRPRGPVKLVQKWVSDRDRVGAGGTPRPLTVEHGSAWSRSQVDLLAIRKIDLAPAGYQLNAGFYPWGAAAWPPGPRRTMLNGERASFTGPRGRLKTFWPSLHAFRAMLGSRQAAPSKRPSGPPQKARTSHSVRNRSVNWILEGYNAINKPELVQKAFALCAVPETEFNLSYESLTSHAAQQAILNLRASDLNIYASITSGTQAIAAGNDSQVVLEDIPALHSLEDDISDLGDHTVDKLCELVLTSRSASEVAERCFDELGESDNDTDGSELEDEAPVPRLQFQPPPHALGGLLASLHATLGSTGSLIDAGVLFARVKSKTIGDCDAEKPNACVAYERTKGHLEKPAAGAATLFNRGGNSSRGTTAANIERSEKP
ncbi:hypothetical protein BDV93DRAFT_607690 [Ceratobasidium sp. AG-I]|nr:hypothetical protein BDV93DRAFT_607690 [Ceratobasidium sp. AG-I]